MSLSESDFRRAILTGYPDRVAQRREPGSPSVRLASGAGATIAPESGVRDGEFLLALDVSRNPQPATRNPQPAKIRLASPRRARVAAAHRVRSGPSIRQGQR